MQKLNEINEIIFVRKELHQQIEESDSFGWAAKCAMLFAFISMPWMAFSIVFSAFASMLMIAFGADGSFLEVFFNEAFPNMAMLALFGCTSSLLVTLLKCGDFNKDSEA